MLLNLLCLAILTGCISATLLNCFQKWLWLDYYDLYVPNRCNFCIGFWLSVMQAGAVAAYLWEWHWMVAPFAAAAITKKLLQ